MLFGLPLGLLAAPVSLSSWYLCRAMPLPGTSPVRVGATALAAAIVTAAVWAAVGQGWWQLLVRFGVMPGSAPMASLSTLLVGLGALAYLLSLAVHYLLQAFEDSAAAARRALESQVAPARSRAARAARAGRSPFPVQQPQLDHRAHRRRSGEGAADVPAARRTSCATA